MWGLGLYIQPSSVILWFKLWPHLSPVDDQAVLLLTSCFFWQKARLIFSEARMAIPVHSSGHLESPCTLYYPSQFFSLLGRELGSLSWHCQGVCLSASLPKGSVVREQVFWHVSPRFLQPRKDARQPKQLRPGLKITVIEKETRQWPLTSTTTPASMHAHM